MRRRALFLSSPISHSISTILRPVSFRPRELQRQLNTNRNCSPRHRMNNGVYVSSNLLLCGSSGSSFSLAARSFSTSSSLSSPSSSSSTASSEVDKFNKVGDDWWNENSSSGTGPLHAMNPARVTFIRNCISNKLGRSDLPYYKHIKGLRILDVGCGGGLLSESLARLGAIVTGIDLAPRSIEVARKHSQLDGSTQNINYRCASIQDLAKSDEKFDVVCCLEVLEHVDDKVDFISNLVACTNTGGSLFVSTMNRTKKAYAVAIAGAEYITHLLPPGTHDWNSFVTTEEMRIYLQKNGTSVVDMNGIVLDVDKFKRGVIVKSSLQFKLSDIDLDVNYIMHAIKPPSA